MIKIALPNTAYIEGMHLTHCKPYTLKKLKFYNDLFNRLGNKKLVSLGTETFFNKYELDASTVKLMVEPFLKPAYKKKSKKTIDIQNIKSLLTTTQDYFIYGTSNLNYFRDILKFIEEIENDIDDILIGKPCVLNAIKNKIIYTKSNIKRNILEQVFRYEDLSDKGFEIPVNGEKSTWGSYTLTTALGVNVCPYCNRSWINTVGTQNNKATNPQLDHFFSKSDFPILRLSLYNLIPSCETCNARLKGNIKFEYDENLHPYEEGYGNSAKFYSIGNDCESVLGQSNNYTIGITYSDLITQETKDRIEKNHKLFKVDEIYKYHGDIVSEIYLKKQLYSTRYLEMLRSSIRFQKHIDVNELYRIAFSNYKDESEFNKRPFAKLTKDIAEQLKLI